jgi:hypothetical protein
MEKPVEIKILVPNWGRCLTPVKERPQQCRAARKRRVARLPCTECCITEVAFFLFAARQSASASHGPQPAIILAMVRAADGRTLTARATKHTFRLASPCARGMAATSPLSSLYACTLSWLTLRDRAQATQGKPRPVPKFGAQFAPTKACQHPMNVRRFAGRTCFPLVFHSHNWDTVFAAKIRYTRTSVFPCLP